MGLFSSSKSDQPQTPLPSLELRLAHSKDTVIKPGNTITGELTLSTTVPITPQSIEVAFWGQSQTWLRTSSSTNNSTTYYHFRDQAPLFTVTCDVLPKTDGGALLPGQPYVMPFTFTTPMGTGFNRAEVYKHPEDPVFIIGPHDLPPTFFHGRNGPDRPDQCSISYGVTAHLTCASLPAGGHSCTAPVLFAPLNPYTHIQHPNRHRYAKKLALSSSVLAGAAAASVGFRQSLKDKLSSQTPRLDFELAVELPDLLRSGAEFAFRSSFAVLSKTENVTRVPEITFKVLKLELLDFTLFRAPRDWAAANTMSGGPSRWRDGTPRSSFRTEHSGYGESKTLLNAVPESETVELPEVLAEKAEKRMVQAGECEAWFTGRVPGFTPPSFQSFAVTRTYRFKVKMRVEVGGKNFDFVVEGGEVVMGSA
ncbi:uncharacterized protein BDZ99DRAFT_467087 [Mytilinidion resinicola]|uniref:Arrestin-like N-terminal domain-containing protein n=1 Tax=Mytilinidion resinicola TaxID=574789 RepID=A0A6A6YAI1_9PEZI|nr:uncharacterized protein BDZ99DRAFT_467087 [Mytilinidion resinicola]KAF2804837.1 hypothetical protein BDZ99DRAFT_467087 [Mytilinidion resinicola]